MHPGPPILGLLGLANVGGAGALAGGGKTATVLATATVAVTAGAAGILVTQHRTLAPGDPAPRIVPGSKNRFVQKIVKGSGLPPRTAFVDATVRLPPVEHLSTNVLRMTCPAGYVGTAPVPREQDGKDPALRGGGVVDPKQLGHSRTIDWELNWTHAGPPHTVTVRMGLLCEKTPLRPTSSVQPAAPSP